jgi:hypothetical protein
VFGSRKAGQVWAERLDGVFLAEEGMRCGKGGEGEWEMGGARFERGLQEGGVRLVREGTCLRKSAMVAAILLCLIFLSSHLLCGYLKTWAGNGVGVLAGLS